MIVSRKAEIKDKEALFKFYLKAYPENFTFRIDPYWTWQNINNPLIPGDKKTEIFIAIDSSNDNIVGQYILVPHNYYYHDEILVVYWGMFFYVLDEYRGQGIGKKLQQMTVEDNRFYLAVSVAESTRKLIKKLGGFELGEVFTQSYIINVDRNIAEKYLMKSLKSSVITKPIYKILRRNLFPSFIKNLLIARFINKTNNYLRKNSSQENFEFVEEIEFNDLRLLKLKSSMRKVYDAFPIDDLDYMKWKFKDHPVKKYKVFILEDDKSNGFIILREGVSPETKTGIISDIFSSSDSGLKLLLKFAIRHFSFLGCESVNLITPGWLGNKPFKETGFFKTNRRVPVGLTNPQLSITNIKDIKKWYFSFESQDLDYYPNTRL